MDEHWVQDQQLRRVMQELSLKLQRHTPGSLPQDPEDAVDKAGVEQSFRQAEQLANGLAAAVVRIPATVNPARMGEAQHTEFRRLADTLRDNSFKLREAAGAKSVERMQQELRAVNSTCIDCHRQFRDFAGMIDFTRASAD
jgi:cytochrome c556